MIDPNRLCLGCMNELEEENKICKICGWNNEEGENKPHQLQPGMILQGKYLVGKVLGEGGFGITYLGWNILLQEKVAIKEFYPHGFVGRDATVNTTVMSYVGQEEFTEKQRDAFIKESRTMSDLRKIEGIVEMKDIFTENQTVYIVMEYIEGVNLKEYVNQNGNLSMDRAIQLLSPVINALEKVHATGLIHRDISPDNIMICPDGRVVLLDFGAARQISADGGHSLTINLKHGYAPMEQYQTHGEQGPWTDIYALCATIYRLITGKILPSAADRVLDDCLVKPSELGANITPEQEKVLLKGLAVRITERYLNIFELRDAFKKASEKPKEEPVRIKSELSKKKDFFEEKSEEGIKNSIQAETISAGAHHTVALKKDGSVIATGYDFFAQCDVSDWSNIVSVSAGSNHTVGLKTDGTVIAVGRNDSYQYDVYAWTDIVALSAGENYTVGLKTDGTVVAVGDNIYGQCNVSEWKDIIAVSAGYDHTVGLKIDGTVVAVGNSANGECDVSDWTDIIAVSASSGYTVGLKSDGTAISVGYNSAGRTEVSDWTDIISISAGEGQTVGLKSNGTVVTTDWFDEDDIDNWSDIIAISAGGYHTVGLKADGTVVTIGDNIYGQCNVSEWKGIKLPGNSEEKEKSFAEEEEVHNEETVEYEEIVKAKK